MTQGRSVLGALGLSAIAVLGLLAFGTGLAQAENLTDGGKLGLFLVLKSSALVAGATFTGQVEGSLTKLIPGRNLSIKCAHTDFLEGKFLSDTKALAQVLLLECKALVRSNEAEEVVGCTIKEKMMTGAAVITPRKHEGKFFILIEPDPPTTFFGIVEFEKEKGCPLPLKNEIKGSFAAELKASEGVVLLGTASEAAQKLLGAKMLFGAFEAFVDASATVELTGAHTGCSFGIA